jgi:hypothetical protein
VIVPVTARVPASGIACDCKGALERSGVGDLKESGVAFAAPVAPVTPVSRQRRIACDCEVLLRTVPLSDLQGLGVAFRRPVMAPITPSPT